jgi:hypothetical protein
MVCNELVPFLRQRLKESIDLVATVGTGSAQDVFAQGGESGDSARSGGPECVVHGYGGVVVLDPSGAGVSSCCTAVLPTVRWSFPTGSWRPVVDPPGVRGGAKSALPVRSLRVHREPFSPVLLSVRSNAGTGPCLPLISACQGWES